ncbi:hypothetical protein G3444_11915 [Shewanella baltica]|uniref:hypothetical protein n=1 Tax=Shewanella baltica TaxID=62322 RepID=UPI00217E77AD|nr:hypothetical protein [Shewanella baltica]MCS6119612.1 hypothetical protein [Shewanella baltica]
MIQPQSNFHDLFGQLEQLLKYQGQLSPFETAALKRDIGKIADFSERELLYALLFTVCNDSDEAISRYKKLISAGIDDFVVNSNYVSSLVHLNKPVQAYRQLARVAELFPNAISLLRLMNLQLEFLDIKSALVTAQFFKEKSDDEELREKIDPLYLVDMVDDFIEHTELITFENLKSIGFIGMKFIEDNSIRCKSFAISIGIESEYLVIRYLLDSNLYTVDEAEEFNNKLLNILIDENFDLLPVVQQFNFIAGNTGFNLVKDNG